MDIYTGVMNDTSSSNETDPCDDCVVNALPSKHYLQLVSPDCVNKLRNFATAAAMHLKAPGDRPQAYAAYVLSLLRKNWRHLDNDVRSAILSMLAPCAQSGMNHCEGTAHEDELPPPPRVPERLGRRDGAFEIPVDDTLLHVGKLPDTGIAGAFPLAIPVELSVNPGTLVQVKPQIPASDNACSGRNGGDLLDYSGNSVKPGWYELEDHTVDEASPEVEKILDAQATEEFCTTSAFGFLIHRRR